MLPQINFVLIICVIICGCNVKDNVNVSQDSLNKKKVSQHNKDTTQSGFNVKWLNQRKDSFEKPIIIPLTAREEAAIEIGYQKELDELNKKWQGKQAPTFTAIDFYGKKVPIQSVYAKKYVLLDFWASWCVPCRKAVPFLKDITKNYESSLQVVSITSDDPKEEWRDAILKEKTINWINLRPEEITRTTNGFSPSVPDGIGDSYGIGSIPTWVLISKGGIIAGVYGNTDESRNKLKATLDSLFSK